VFADKLNHASLVDAAQLSGASFTRYRHGDLAQLEGQLAASTAQDKLIVSDLVFSMDGDVAPVDALLELAERYDAWLYLDDAHGFGVLNAGRGGLTERARASDRVIYLATLGKAAGVAGAAVAAHASVVDWLIQKARPYVYTTASPPLLAACLLESLRQIEAGESRRERLSQPHRATARGAGRPETRRADAVGDADPAAGDRRECRGGAAVAGAARARPAGAGDPHADGAGRHGAAAHHAVGRARPRRRRTTGRGAA
jgi:7-keto-8-aminopelargonate synthetase-like enzyme